jgi:putative FmdB family regulatory protein
MPTYEYVCPKCGHEFEQFQQMSAEPIKRCPKCKKLGVKRLVGKGAGLIFKGTGFYITDYKKTAAPKEGGEGGSGGGEAKPGGGEGKATGGESKPGDGKSAGGDKSGGESKSSESAKSSSDSKSSADAKPAAKEKPKGGQKS